MKNLFILILFFTEAVSGQKLKKADKQILTGLQSHITYLADDKLEGRRTGTAGEKMANNYIVTQYNAIGLIPMGDNNTYLQKFEINEGKQIDPTTYLIINGNDLSVEKDFFPLEFSGNGSLEAAPVIALQEKGMPWFWDIKEVL